jgi:Prenyltransferase and squalene oxidase repeat
MSWQLASFLILGVGLLAGFAWYERSRPPSQVVALVAALAALAVAGRIAFAAFPNVKPTTDIVVFAGYALGGAPGFAVGALTAVVSNFWFGQGPWTPWQMAGWGLCGILGAAVSLGGRGSSRFVLAATCGLAAVMYGALLNFSLMATSGGELSWRYFGLLEARAVPFEIAHATGNVAFALIAGPVLVRMLGRFRERFEWRRGAPARRPKAALHGAAALLLTVLAIAALLPGEARASDVSRAADWLEAVQNSDGGFGPSPGKDSSAETTCWVMLGLESAGRNPFDVQDGGHTPVDYLRANLDEAKSPGDLARTILALEGAGVDPRDFGGENLVAKLLSRRRDDGSYVGWPGSTAFAVIALRAAGIDGGVEKSLEWLRGVQNGDGGWGDVPGSPSTPDGTGAALQALSPDSQASVLGVRFLKRHQSGDGGFALGGSAAVNTQSTAWAVQGMIAAGRDPDELNRNGTTALDYLAHNQRGDGSYRYADPSDGVGSAVADQTPVFVTGEALAAVAHQPFPVPPPRRKPQPKPSSTPTSPAPAAVPPSTSVPLPPSESPPSIPGFPSSGAGGGDPGHSTPSAKIPPGAQPSTPLPGGGVPGASPGTAPEPLGITEGEPTAETTGAPNDESSSALGAVILGLVAGGLLFALGLGTRRGWMRWRYGL